MNAERIERMRSRLETALSPERLEIDDDSHLHVGHAGARDGRGHFSIRISSRKFAGANRIQRHRMVFEALGDMMQTDIHAVKVMARTPDQDTSPKES